MLTQDEILMVIAMMIALGIIILCLIVFLRDIYCKLTDIAREITGLKSHSDLPPSNFATRRNKPISPKTVRKL